MQKQKFKKVSRSCFKIITILSTIFDILPVVEAGLEGPGGTL